MTRALILAVAALSGSALAQLPWFQALGRQHLEPDPGPIARCVLADVDGDGRKDLLLRTDASTPVQSFYRNDTHAAFTLQPLQFAGNLAHDVAVADVDGDGKDDLMVQGRLYRNLGNGQFALDAAAMPANADGIDQQVFADLDGDGVPDLLARAQVFAGPGLRAFHNDGTGHFTEMTAAAFGTQSAQVASFAVADVDGDGDRDVVVATINAPTGMLWRNDGLGHFTATPVPALANIFPGTMVHGAADLDGDGDLDLLVTIAGSPVQVLQNDGTGAFTAVNATGLAPSGGGLLVDLDGDGRADVVVGGDGSGCWHNAGGFQFAWQPFPAWPWSVTAFSAADLDGDGDLDLVGAGGPLRVLLQGGSLFQDAVRPPVLRVPPGTARAIRSLDARLDHGAQPAAEVAWLENGQPFLLSGRDPAGRFGATFPFGLVAMPPLPACTSVAVCDPAGTGAVGLVACTAQAVQLLVRTDAYTLTDASSRLHPLGTPGFAACADLRPGSGDEIVLGAPDVAGPQILVADAAGQFWPVVPPLPPAAPSACALREHVLLADMDGDGDLDIVHELRVIRNDGNGWSPGADFSALVPPDALGMVALDFDGDGDLDLVVWSPTLLLLLENTGTAFRDATYGHLPLGPWQSTGVSVGDVDRDGDPDLLVIEGSYWSTLLRNDHGVFTRFTNAAPIGVLVDLDHDQVPDLFDGYTLLQGRYCRLHAPRLPTLGASYRLDLATWRQGAHAQAALVALCMRPAFFDLGRLGLLRLDPTAAVTAGILLSAGLGSLPVPIPAAPPLQGTPFWCQALVLDAGGGLLLTSAVAEVIR